MVSVLTQPQAGMQDCARDAPTPNQREPIEANHRRVATSHTRAARTALSLPLPVLADRNSRMRHNQKGKEVHLDHEFA